MRPARETQRPHKKPQQHLSNNKKTLTKTHPKKKKKKKIEAQPPPHTAEIDHYYKSAQVKSTMLQKALCMLETSSDTSPLRCQTSLRNLDIYASRRFCCVGVACLLRERGGRLCCMLPMQEREKGWGGEMYVLACKTFCNFFY